MTKEEKIKESWGIHFSSDVDENGYITYTEYQDIHLLQWVGDFWEKGFNKVLRIYWVRPKSLRGIENNNGWIKIESENDLPKDKSIDVIVDSKPYQGFIYEANCGLFCCIENRYNQNELSEIIEANLITHYQPIFKPAIPLY